LTNSDAQSLINVLVVDDDYFVCTMLQLQLKAIGCNPFTASTAESALQTLPEHNIQVAVIDLHLPQMDGLQLITAIHEYDPTIQCIVLTGAASTETAVKALRVQVYDYVMKPISQNDLNRLVWRAAEYGQLMREKRLADATLVRRSEELSASLEALHRVQDDLIRSANAALMGQLADGMQHELGNALTVIHLNMNLLKVYREDPDQFGHHLTSMGQGVKAIERMMIALGDFPTQEDAGLETLDLVDVLKQARVLVEKTYPLATGSIRFDLVSPALTCGDEYQLTRALVGILENAIEASFQNHPEGIEVSVRVRADGDRWRIAIVDNGFGFRSDALTQATEPGFTTKIERGFMRGLGMGLFITSTVLDNHGGELKLANLPEGGALVEIWLPRS
jgi:C4-dicarboxylate-specific signal transduction histidine kinase